MSLLGRLLGRTPQPKSKDAPAKSWQGGRVRAKFDSALPGQNDNHWANADGLSANAAVNPHVRSILRMRSRYEVQNNGYLAGLVKTLADDLVGTGPRAQIAIPQVPPAALAAVSARFAHWWAAAAVTDKLRVKHEAAVTDGEGFALLVTNPELADPVKLDLRNVEADQVADPTQAWNDPYAVDGIRYDHFGNVTEYHVLAHHPGGRLAIAGNPWQAIPVPAAHMLHWFRPSRPNQARGVPQLTPSLPLAAQMRRYTLAVIAAAETAANISGVMHTDQAADPDDPGGPQKGEPFDQVQLARNALLTLPEGWDAKGFDATQPTSTYREFKAEILNEMARPVGAPFNVITGNSSGYNYSSARLDHLLYYRTVWIERGRMERLLARVFRAWAREAALVPGYLPEGLPHPDAWAVEWQWDGFESIDPTKDAEATDAELRLGLTTYAEECAGRGRDWRATLEQQAVETRFRESLGLADPLAAPPAPKPPQPPTPEAARA